MIAKRHYGETGVGRILATIDSGINNAVGKIGGHRKVEVPEKPKKTATEIAKEVNIIACCRREELNNYIKFRYDRVSKRLDIGIPTWGKPDENTITGVYEKNNPQLNLILGAEEVSKEAEVIHIAITNFLNQNQN